jgi:dethiobiotin synthetase
MTDFPIHLLVTGTSTGVGKTMATAALASALASGGWRVSVVKPVQTGTATGEPSDVETIRMLTGLDDVRELTSLPDPLAPDTAARLRRLDTPSVVTLADQIAQATRDVHFVLIEGAGGALVRLDTYGGTLLDLGRTLEAMGGGSVSVLIVTTLALGTLNHTELTVQATRSTGLRPWGLVIGSLPPELGLAERLNRTELPRVTGLPVLAELPAGVGGMQPDAFRAAADSWFLPMVRDLGPPPRHR